MKYRYLNESLWDDAEIDNDEIEQSHAEVKSSLEQNYSDYVLNAAYDAIYELDHSYDFFGRIDSIAKADPSSDYPKSLKPFAYDFGFAIYWYYKKLYDTDDIEELQKYLIIPLDCTRDDDELKNKVRTALSVIYKHIPKVLKNRYESLYDLPFTLLIYRSKLTPVDGKFILQQLDAHPATMDITYYDKFKNIKMIGINRAYFRSFFRSNVISVSISCNDFDKNFKVVKKNVNDFNALDSLFRHIDKIYFDLKCYSDIYEGRSDDEIADLIGRCCKKILEFSIDNRIECFVNICDIHSNSKVKKLLLKKNYPLFSDSKHIKL